ncbi:MAG: polysaccharide deacetylase family protein [Actinomycetota bacterium]|nr:polysaccharide deacetylase family protein [Actinomycetota bacterium]
MERNSKPTILICLLILLALTLFYPGVSKVSEQQGSSAKLSPQKELPLFGIKPYLTKELKEPSSDRIAGPKLITFGGQIVGKLPRVNPTLITRGNPNLERVAITIDDGWRPDMRILSFLKSSSVPFTAFLIGGREVAESHPELVRAIKESGGEVCNHTYSHFVMVGKPREFVVREIWKAQEIITSLTHEIYPYVRFSGGVCDKAIIDWAAEQGFWVANWTVDSLDTRKGIRTEEQVNHIAENLCPGAIILFHFGGYNTFDVLSRLIPVLRSKGYKPTSLSEVLEGTPYRLEGKAKPGKHAEEKGKEEEGILPYRRLLERLSRSTKS